MAFERNHAPPIIPLWLACAGFALAFSPRLAAAEPSASERETARALMKEGDGLRAEGDLRSAMARYQTAHALVHVPTTGLDLARVQAQLGLLVEARSTATEVIHLPVTPGEPRVFGEARLAAAALAADLEPHVPALKTQVTPNDVAYTLAIDGVALPAQARGVAFRLNPGTHSVRVEADGYVAETRQVALLDGQTETLSIGLTRWAIATRGPDGRAEEARAEPAPSGSLQPAARDSAVDPAAAGRVRGIVGVSVGGAVLALGTVTGIVSVTKTNHEKELCDHGACDPSQSSALSSANALANVANVCIPLGLVGIAYGVYELMTLPSVESRTARANRVRVDVVGTGVTLRGVL